MHSLRSLTIIHCIQVKKLDKEQMGYTYDTVWAIAPAMPPHRRFTCVFKTKTSGLSNEGLPSRLGACVSPMFFKVPKVKNERPENQNENNFFFFLPKLIT